MNYALGIIIKALLFLGQVENEVTKMCGCG